MLEQTQDKRNIPITSMRRDLVESYHHCLGLVAQERRYIGFLEAPPLSSSTEWVEKMLSKGFPFEVAIFRNKVMGWCDIGPNERAGFEHGGTLGTALHPDFRGFGLGRKLITSAIQKADILGLERIELEVFGSNNRAQNLYKKLGFETEGVRKNARKIDGVYDDVIIMARLRGQQNERA